MGSKPVDAGSNPARLAFSLTPLRNNPMTMQEALDLAIRIAEITPLGKWTSDKILSLAVKIKTT